MAKIFWVMLAVVVILIVWYGCRKAGEGLIVRLYALKVSLSYAEKLEQNSLYRCGFYDYLDQAFAGQEMSLALMTIANDLGYMLLMLLTTVSNAVILALGKGDFPCRMVVALSVCWMVMLVVDITRAWRDVILVTLAKADAAGEAQMK